MDREQSNQNDIVRSAPVNHLKKWLVLFVCVIVVACLGMYVWGVSAPEEFPVSSVVTVSSGENLKTIVADLKKQQVIRSSVVFQSLVILFGGEKKVMAGDYLLSQPENAIGIALRIVRGNFGMEEVKVTFPEGFSVANMADTLEQKLVRFDKPQFLKLATKKEGYLFPDTYFFPPTATTNDIVTRMQVNFDIKIKQFDGALKTSAHSRGEIVTMASILEGEAVSTKDRQIVSGILWNRIKQKIPLQVDATFRYINGKTTQELTLDDLKIDSPYNTYVYRGLPPTPINNPGIDALFAALNPAKTNYLYFLTGKDGVMHYAITFEEHKKNKERYLK